MTTSDISALPPAEDRAGVEPGWWATTVRYGSRTAHRLSLSVHSGRRSEIAVCGRKVKNAEQVPDDCTTDVHPACRDCIRKSERALAPGATERIPAPPPTVRRLPSATTTPGENTAAARVGRRVAFRNIVELSDEAHAYLARLT